MITTHEEIVDIFYLETVDITLKLLPHAKTKQTHYHLTAYINRKVCKKMQCLSSFLLSVKKPTVLLFLLSSKKKVLMHSRDRMTGLGTVGTVGTGTSRDLPRERDRDRDRDQKFWSRGGPESQPLSGCIDLAYPPIQDHFPKNEGGVS